MAVPSVSMLSFAEDLSLLLLDESSGVLYPLPGRTLDFGLASVTLLELTEAWCELGEIGPVGRPAATNFR